MAHTGDTLEHPVTGERVVWLKVAADTDGELLRGEISVRPGGFIAAAHIHPAQEERFEFVAGTVTLVLDGKERIVRAGESAVVPAGRPHVWWNSGDDTVRAIVEFRPALRSEVFFETFFGLGRDGKVNARGLPNLLQMAVLLRAFDAEIRLAKPPYVIQRILFGPLALLGRALGYRASYPRYSSQPLEEWSA